MILVDLNTDKLTSALMTSVNIEVVIKDVCVYTQSTPWKSHSWISIKAQIQLQ